MHPRSYVRTGEEVVDEDARVFVDDGELLARGRDVEAADRVAVLHELDREAVVDKDLEHVPVLQTNQQTLQHGRFVLVLFCFALFV